MSETSCNTSAFTCTWLLESKNSCCEKIVCSIPSFSTMSCNITCDSETGFQHCIINHKPSSVEQTYINIAFANDNWELCKCGADDTNTNITFANNHLPNNWYPCICPDGNFTPINCSIMRPTQTTLISNTEVLATTIPFPTTTVTNASIASIVAPAVTVTTMLLCISVAAGSALLCAYMKKRKQDLTTLHSDSNDQQKYSV